VNLVGLRGGADQPHAEEHDEANWAEDGGHPQTADGRSVVSVTEQFVVNEVTSLQSYLPHLQQYQNPLVTRAWPINTNFVGINETVTDTVFCNSLRAQSKGLTYNQWVRAGPRKHTFFTPSEVNAAIVSCGGLDPGINIVVKEITCTLTLAYNVRRAWGVRFGWRGFTDPAAKEWLELTQERVANIHKEGGSILGYSADTCHVETVLNVLEERGINQLYVLGNVESCRAASEVQLGAVKRKLKLSVIFIPKSIENNFPFIDKCIGFDTVVQGAVDAIHRVLLAASSVQGGIGIVKLGSGFMCLNAVMASGDADVCLLKAIPFQPKVVMEYVAKVIASKGYAIIVVEDGAAEDLVKKWKQKLDEDAASGIHHAVGGSMDECIGKRVPSYEAEADQSAFSGQHGGYDVGQYLKETAIEHFAQHGMQVTVRLSTPEWYIRSMPALASDRIFCTIVASTAVHGAFAGLMNVVVGRVNQRYVYLPTSIISEKNRPVVKETSRMYNRMIRATGQPSFQRLGHAKLITGRGDVRRAFTPDQALSDLAQPGDSGERRTFGV